MRIMCNGVACFAVTISCLTLFAVGDVRAATKRMLRQDTQDTTQIAEPKSISEKCFTFRSLYSGRPPGIYVLHLEDTANLGFNGTSRVFVAAGEGTTIDSKVITAATYTVHEVAPRLAGVDFTVQITDASSTGVSVDFLACNP